MSTCAVCDGTRLLLSEPCPLCNDEEDDDESVKTSAYWCDVCEKQMQSPSAWESHCSGRKHLYLCGTGRVTLKLQAPSEEQLFDQLVSGAFQNIVICTGAGVSTAAGVPDFRSPGGLFETIRARFGVQAEELLSRQYADADADRWKNEVEPFLQRQKWTDASPTLTHWFCAWLHQRGWLRRVYTQNVDGLHTNGQLNLPPEFVVEAHGALRDKVVLYGDDLPRRFYNCCREDFSEPGVDLIIVFGTSLQVAPFCAVPNLAPKGCVRVLVNTDLGVCLRNNFSRPSKSSVEDLSGLSFAPATATLGGQKKVSLRPLWCDRKACRKWPQKLIESSCDDFVSRFFASESAVNAGFQLTPR